jgi:hypothetical protein
MAAAETQAALRHRKVLLIFDVSSCRCGRQFAKSVEVWTVDRNRHIVQLDTGLLRPAFQLVVFAC